MSTKAVKSVLIVDDQEEMRHTIEDSFLDCNDQTDYPYRFEVDGVSSTAECIQKVSTRSYDVIVLDVKLSGENGLDVSFTFGLQQQLGFETPIRVIFTGHPDYQHCVESMRHGAWDYIVKEDVGEKRAGQILVDSVVSRLRQLDLRHAQEQRIVLDWLPRQIGDLQSQFGGQIIAIWHEPDVQVIAAGKNAFELEAQLKAWRSAHARWEQPFIIRVPPRDDSRSDN